MPLTRALKMLVLGLTDCNPLLEISGVEQYLTFDETELCDVPSIPLLFRIVISLVYFAVNGPVLVYTNQGSGW